MVQQYKNITTIGFDADDTLWDNEIYFRFAEKKFSQIMNRYPVTSDLMQHLMATEIKNLPLYGYGVKSFTLSMLETAISCSESTISGVDIMKIIKTGQEILTHPVTIYPETEETLIYLRNKYKIILITKGELHDQERKLKASSLGHLFHHIEIISDKTSSSYKALLQHHKIKPSEFLMVGNSLRSDIFPVLEIGGQAIQVPTNEPWEYENQLPDTQYAFEYQEINALKSLRNFL